MEGRWRVVEVARRCSNFFLDLLFPIECLACRVYGSWICKSCFGKIALLTEQVCPSCGTKDPLGRRCIACAGQGYTLDGLIAATLYHDPLIGQAVGALKYSFVQTLAPLLGELLVEQFMRYGLDDAWWVAVPVPLHPRRLRARGFNQAMLLANHILQKTGILVAEVLTRTRWATPQVDLNGENRRRNLNNVFACVDASVIKGRKVLLVDDVATTCSTLAECAKALKAAGAFEVWGLVVARG